MPRGTIRISPAPANSSPRLLLLLPTSTYRASAFMAAADALNLQLTVASEEDSAFSTDEPDNLATLDFADPAASAERALSLHQSRPFAAVFGVDDQTAVIAAHIAAKLGLPHNSIAAVEASADKYRQRVALARAGIPVPRFERQDLEHLTTAWAEFPAIVKPIALSASRGVIRVDDPGQLHTALARLDRILAEASQPAPHLALIEQYIPGPEFALEGMLYEEELHTLALFDKPDPLEGPHFAETLYVTPSRAPDSTQRNLRECAASACRALGLGRGPVHVELRYNELGPWLIELAARPIGGRCGQVLRFGPQATTSLETVLLGQALGRWETAPPRESSAAGVMMIPVPRAGTFRTIGGVTDALRVPRITDVAVTAAQGTVVRPLPEEARYLGFIFARGPDPVAVEGALRTARDRLEVVLD